MEPDQTRNVVDVEVLRRAINLIFDNLQKSGVKSVAITDNDNLFWDMDINAMFNVRAEQPELAMGSVQDSAEFLTRMVASARSASDAPFLMFMHAAPILYFLAHKLK